MPELAGRSRAGRCLRSAGLPVFDSRRDGVWKRGGPTGGFLVLMQLTPSLTAGPELRYTLGLITDDPSYSVVRLTTRVIWSF